MKFITICLICLFTSFTVLAQDETTTKRLWFSVEIGRAWGLSDNGKSGNVGNDDGQLYTNIIRAKVGYYVLPQLSVGLGIGLSLYDRTDPESSGLSVSNGMNTAPFVIDLRYHPIKSLPKLFVFTDLGTSLTNDDGRYTDAYIADLGLGYRLKLGKRTSFNPSIGYNLFSYSVNWWSNESERRNRHSIFLQLGFEF